MAEGKSLREGFQEEMIPTLWCKEWIEMFTFQKVESEERSRKIKWHSRARGAWGTPHWFDVNRVKVQRCGRVFLDAVLLSQHNPSGDSKTHGVGERIPGIYVTVEKSLQVIL